MGQTCGMCGEKKNAYRVVCCCAGENFEKWPFARPRHKWEDSIKMDHK